jgi:hypothetical protein
MYNDSLFTMQNVLDIERSILEQKSKQSEFVFKKKRAEDELAFIKNRIRANQKHLPEIEYKSLCKKQDVLKKEKTDAEQEISKIQTDIQKKSLLKDEIKNELKERANTNLPDTLTALRDYYMAFASDKTRVGSMRAMASEFAEKIESIIKTL